MFVSHCRSLAASLLSSEWLTCFSLWEQMVRRLLYCSFPSFFSSALALKISPLASATIFSVFMSVSLCLPPPLFFPPGCFLSCLLLFPAIPLSPGCVSLFDLPMSVLYLGQSLPAFPCRCCQVGNVGSFLSNTNTSICLFSTT